jgi:hypothetical protein
MIKIYLATVLGDMPSILLMARSEIPSSFIREQATETCPKNGHKNGPENLRFRGRLAGCWQCPETGRFLDARAIPYLQELSYPSY